MKHDNLFKRIAPVSLPVIATFTFFVTVFLPDACGDTAGQHPNIVFILADDMGYGDVSALNPEGKIKTPQIDRLSAEGMYFTDMHSPSSVCTPTRYGIITGRYNWRSRLKNGVLGGYSKTLIEPGRETIASMLKKSGYHTAVIGKWHLGLDWAVKPLPNDSQQKNGKPKPDADTVDFSKPFANGPLTFGFDYFFGIAASLDMPPYVFLENDRVTEIPATQKKWVRQGAAAASFEAADVLPETTKKAIAYIESRTKEAQNGTPFFLYFPLSAPHTPILPAAPWVGASGLNPYADFVMQVDDTVGRIIETVDRCGLKENTLIIFTADNGCSPAANIKELIEKGHHPNGIFRGHKADIFDGGHRVPFLVRWSQKIKAGSSSGQLACLVDMMKTFADISGQTLPDTAAEDSVSMLPAFLSSAATPLRQEVIHHSINGSFAIRQGDWKLCLCGDSGGWSVPRPKSAEANGLPPNQLYNMKDDVQETANAYEKHTERLKGMQERLQTLVTQGRSTPGKPQQNTGEVRLRNEK